MALSARHSPMGSIALLVIVPSGTTTQALEVLCIHVHACTKGICWQKRSLGRCHQNPLLLADKLPAYHVSSG